MSRARSAVERAKSQSTGDNSPIADALDALVAATSGTVQLVQSITQAPAGGVTTIAAFPDPVALIPVGGANPIFSLEAGDKLLIAVVHGLQLNAAGATGEVLVGARLSGVSPFVAPVAIPLLANTSTTVATTLVQNTSGNFTELTAPLTAGTYKVELLWGVNDPGNTATNDASSAVNLTIEKVLALSRPRKEIVMSVTISAVERAKSQRLGNNNPLSDAFDALVTASSRGISLPVPPTSLPAQSTSSLVPVLMTGGTFNVNVAAGDTLLVQVNYAFDLTGLFIGPGGHVVVTVKDNGVVIGVSTSTSEPSGKRVSGVMVADTGQAVAPGVKSITIENNVSAAAMTAAVAAGAPVVVKISLIRK